MEKHPCTEMMLILGTFFLGYEYEILQGLMDHGIS